MRASHHGGFCEPATDRWDFGYFDNAAICAGCTARLGQVEGRSAKISIIKGDKAKTDVYCQINDLGEQIDGADQKKAEALSQQVIELEKKLGPEYSVLVNDLKNVDPNSPEGRDIDSILAPLDDSCD